MKVFITYIIIINLYAIYIMYIDKKNARGKKWRVPEAKLFVIAILLGSPGILIGMQIFRHKTKHLKFVYGIPVILIVQIYLIYKLMKMSFNI